MQARITLLTLGVRDLERAVAFYRDGLGFETSGIVGSEVENGAVAFFRLDGGLKLALWPRKSLAADDAARREAQAIAVERDGALEVVDAERQQRDARLHAASFAVAASASGSATRSPPARRSPP